MFTFEEKYSKVPVPMTKIKVFISESECTVVENDLKKKLKKGNSNIMSDLRPP